MITVVINGTSFDYPEVGDTEWGDAATNAFKALAGSTLQNAVDISDPTATNEFTLLNTLDLGGNYGVKVLFISSRSSNPAQSGVFRLCNGELVAWRNNDDDGDNTITFDSDGDLLVNGVKVTLHGQIVNADVAAGAGIEESKLSLDYSTDSLNTAITTHVSDTANPHNVTKSQVLTGDLIVNADVDNSAAIVESKLSLNYSTSGLNTAITSHTGDTSNPHSTTISNLTDTTIATPNSGDVVSYDGSKWINQANSVSNLTDTTITSAASGQVLTYDGSKWINQASASASLTGLTDTDITTPSNGDTLLYNSVSTKWENSDKLTTVDTNLTLHTSDTANPHSTTVSNLDDTTITTSADGDTLVYDSVSTKWINSDSLKTHLADTNNPHDTTVSNLDDTTITTPSDQDTIVYDSNSSKWINQENSINNLNNVSIDSNTLAVGDALVFDDQDSLWKNNASFTNHIGNAANPHLTTVAKLTDASITTPANKDLLQYDYANSQWINSNDVWSTIEVNDIANINNAVTDITLTASDKRHQIFTSASGFTITLPSTGIKAGGKFIFDWTNSTITSTYTINASDNSNLMYVSTGMCREMYTAKVDNPTTSTDWIRSWYVINRNLYTSTSGAVAFTTVANTRKEATSPTLFTLNPGIWQIDFSGNIILSGGTISAPTFIGLKNSSGILSMRSISCKFANLYMSSLPLGSGSSLTFFGNTANAWIYEPIAKSGLYRCTTYSDAISAGLSIQLNTAGTQYGVYTASATFVAPVNVNI